MGGRLVSRDDVRRARRTDQLYRDRSGAITREWLCARVARLEMELEEAGEQAAQAAARERPVAPTIVSDGATGWCRCAACGRPTDPWDAWCRWCGQRQDDTRWTRGE